MIVDLEQVKEYKNQVENITQNYIFKQLVKDKEVFCNSNDITLLDKSEKTNFLYSKQQQS